MIQLQSAHQIARKTINENKQKQKIKQHYYFPVSPSTLLDKQSLIHSGVNQKSRKKKLAFRSEENWGKKGFR
jgi:hypothetical protein